MVQFEIVHPNGVSVALSTLKKDLASLFISYIYDYGQYRPDPPNVDYMVLESLLGRTVPEGHPCLKMYALMVLLCTLFSWIFWGELQDSAVICELFLR